MNPGNPGNFLLSLIATFTLVSLGILAPTAHASDQSLGAVSFANSGSPAAQADFLTGLAQLHNFQYRQAAEAFQRAVELSREPEKVREKESLKLARAELTRQAEATTHPVRKKQIDAALAEIERRLAKA